MKKFSSGLSFIALTAFGMAGVGVLIYVQQ